MHHCQNEKKNYNDNVCHRNRQLGKKIKIKSKSTEIKIQHKILEEKRKVLNCRNPKPQCKLLNHIFYTLTCGKNNLPLNAADYLNITKEVQFIKSNFIFSRAIKIYIFWEKKC